MPDHKKLALIFNGQTDYVTLGNPSELGLASASFTLEAWVKVRSYGSGTDQSIICAGERGTNKGLHFVIRGRKPRLGFHGNDIQGTTVIDPGRWYHLAFRYDLVKKEQSIFVNGFLDASAPGHGPFTGKGTAYLARGWAANEWMLDGFLRDVRIWSRPLTVDEINAAMFMQLRGDEPGLAHYWKLDEGRGNRLLDSGNNNNPGIITNPVWTNEYTPPFLQNQAYLEFKPSKKSYVTTSFHNPPSNELTIEYWFRGKSLQSAVRLQNASGYIVAGWHGKHILSNDGATAKGVSVGASATDGNWHHVAFTWKIGKPNNFISYLDGKQVASSSALPFPPPQPLPRNLKLFLGSYLGVSEFTNGQLAEVRIWSKAMTPAAIAKTMCTQPKENDPNLLVYYKLCEGTGNVAHDFSKRKAHGNIVNATWNTAGHALAFEPVKIPHFTKGGFVSMKSASHLQITGDLSIEMWVCPTAFDKRRSIWYKTYGGEGAISLEVDGRVTFYFGNTGTDGSSHEGLISAFRLPLNEWSHIAFVRDMKNKILNWHLNGVNTNSRPVQKIFTPKASSSPILIGEGYLDPFEGQIAEVRVWNKTLYEATINQNMAKILTGAEEGLVSYLPMREGIGNTLFDVSKFGIHGVFNKPNWILSGLPVASASGKVLAFDGATKVNLPAVAVESGPTLSVCLWFYCEEEPFRSNSIVETYSGNTLVTNIHLPWGDGIVYFDSVRSPMNRIFKKMPVGQVQSRWSHWAFVRNAITGTLEIFLNGKSFQKGTNLKANMQVVSAIVLGDNKRAQKFVGRMAHVQFWKKALTQKEILETKNRVLEGNEPGLTGYYPLDSGGGNTARDGRLGLPSQPFSKLFQGSWKHTAIPQTTKDVIVSVAEFEGNSEAVVVPKTKALNITQAITIEVWVMVSKGAADPIHKFPVVSKFGGTEGFELQFNNQAVAFKLVLNGKAKTLHLPQQLIPQQWYHVAAVFNKPNMILYINGIRKQISKVVGDKITPFQGDLNIGRNPKWTDRSFNGRIAEVRLWNIPRSDAHIKEFMFNELPSGGQSGLVGYWKLDESYGGTAHDSSGNGFNGKLNYVYRTSATLPVQGRQYFSGDALKFHIKELWKVRGELDAHKVSAQDSMIKLKKQVEVLNEQIKVLNAEKLAIENKKDEELAIKLEELREELAAQIKKKEEEISALKDNSTSISRLIENANEEITTARSQLKESDYQLGHVSMQFKMIPTGGGDLIQFPTKEEWGTLNIGSDQLSTLELEFSPKETAMEQEKQEVEVPDVRGLTEIMARRKITNAGFIIDIKYQAANTEADKKKINRVISQLPAPFEEVVELEGEATTAVTKAVKAHLNSTITIFIGKEAKT